MIVTSEHQSHYFAIFFFNGAATTDIYTLSLHDALPIFIFRTSRCATCYARAYGRRGMHVDAWQKKRPPQKAEDRKSTPELQSPDHLVCRLLLEKKKKIPLQFHRNERQDTARRRRSLQVG